MIIALAFLLTSSAHAADLAKALPEYVKIQETLAADKFEGVTDTAKKLAASDAELKSPAINVSKAKNIKEARAAFKELSLPMTVWALKAKPEGFEVVDCPMAKGRWVQVKGPVRNPYYGKDMLECGDVVK